ncbi:hypothetical protein MJO28_015508 [Puccinia striiformis f. sp. tritici]|uniref:Uncharacterized protein n=1 Tax=Puccinia striiformis f. sp. tritici TaxID=168172 RepID=A0ACC0DNY7_9BASI|nr:hypothetical protein MJO28_015508 [Puccinia striiformis f. sp. tritici]
MVNRAFSVLNNYFSTTASKNKNSNEYIPLHHHHQASHQEEQELPKTKNENSLPVKLLTTTLIVLTLISLLILYLTTPSTKTTYHQDWDLKLTELPSQDNPDTCEPFNQAGYLNYDQDHILDNNWVPFNRKCPTISLLKPLVNDLSKLHSQPNPLSFALPWLVNRTVVLIGDSIERFHARDFCDILSATTEPPYHEISENGFSPSKSNQSTPSRSFYVNSKDSPELKPPQYLFNPDDRDAVPSDWPSDQRQKYRDHHLEWADRDNIRTSPWICEVPSYGFRIVTLFTFGIEPYKSGSYYSDQDWFISPSSFIDKLHHTLLPLLENLSRERNEPRIRHPDLIEVSSGLWDLRQWSEEDSRLNNITLDDSTELVYRSLSFTRLEWWAERVTTLLKAIDTAFPSNKDNATAPILWRSLHHTRRHSVAPYSRVEQLDQYARLLIHTLKNNETIANPSLANRLKFDNWGRKMLGFENHFRDPVHPKAVPGSVLWSDMMLWELRKAVAIPSPDDHSVLSSSFKHSGQSVSSPHSSSS